MHGRHRAAPLYIHWPDGVFVFPWYGTFDDALAANPEFVDCALAP